MNKDYEEIDPTDDLKQDLNDLLRFTINKDEWGTKEISPEGLERLLKRLINEVVDIKDQILRK